MILICFIISFIIQLLFSIFLFPCSAVNLVHDQGLFANAAMGAQPQNPALSASKAIDGNTNQNIFEHQNTDQSVNNCPEKSSYLFKFIQFSTRRYTHYKWVNWYSTGKIVLIFLHQRWLGLAVMGNYHSELLMLSNLAFLMKCKYHIINLKTSCLYFYIH